MADKKEVKMLTTKDVAAKLKVDPKFLRGVLRKMGKGTTDEKTRYQWSPDDDLSKLKAAIEKTSADNAKKKTEKKAKPAKKSKLAKPAAKKTAAKPKAKKAPKPPADEDLDATEQDDVDLSENEGGAGETKQRL